MLVSFQKHKFEIPVSFDHFRFRPEVSDDQDKPYYKGQCRDVSSLKVSRLNLSPFSKNRADKVTFKKRKIGRNSRPEVNFKKRKKNEFSSDYDGSSLKISLQSIEPFQRNRVHKIGKKKNNNNNNNTRFDLVASNEKVFRSIMMRQDFRLVNDDQKHTREEINQFLTTSRWCCTLLVS